jgi:hypothetical protein
MYPCPNVAILTLFIELISNLQSIRIRLDHSFQARVEQFNSLQVALRQLPRGEARVAQIVLQLRYRALFNIDTAALRHLETRIGGAHVHRWSTVEQTAQPFVSSKSNSELTRNIIYCVDIFQKAESVKIKNSVDVDRPSICRAEAARIF